jgi:D-xylose transport system substrate-binding protein
MHKLRNAGVAALVLVAAAVLVWIVASTNKNVVDDNTPKASVRIGFSLGTQLEERWQKDADLFTRKVQELGGTVDVQYSGEDSQRQILQAENMIIQGVKTLVVVTSDADATAVIVEKAHAAGVKVIGYDRMINKSDLDLFVTYDSREVGELEALEITRLTPKGKIAYIGGSTTDNNAFLHKEGAMKVLKPLIDRGDVQLVIDSFSPGWKPEEAYKTMKAYLASGKKIDAVVAANDGTAGGVIQALKEYNLAGKVPVSGQDADLSACQRIVQGTQAVTIYKPLATLASEAAIAAVDMARGKAPKTNGTLNNKKIDVPSYFLQPVMVTKQNMDEVIIAGGFHTRAEVYQSTK